MLYLMKTTKLTDGQRAALRIVADGKEHVRSEINGNIVYGLWKRGLVSVATSGKVKITPSGLEAVS